jgi:hypothetical protein
MAFVRNCPALSEPSRDLNWLYFHRLGSVRNFVRGVQCPDKEAFPKGCSDNVVMSDLRPTIKIYSPACRVNLNCNPLHAREIYLNS